VRRDAAIKTRRGGPGTHALDEDYADGLDDTGRRYLATIRDSATRMGQLIDDLLSP